MGVKVYWLIVAAVLIFGLLMPQQGPKKKNYIILMAIIHTIVCGWRYRLMHGDLRKYAWEFPLTADQGWLSNELFHEGRNFGFYWLQKLVSMLTDGNFQTLLIIIAIIAEIAIAVIIYRYSPRPWLSYLIWNCVGFYIFGFYAIKQALAMALLMPAFDAIMKNKPRKFIVWVMLAGCVHTPALVFLPSYWIAKTKINIRTVSFYIIAIALIYIFRDRIVTFARDMYYDSMDQYDATGSMFGGRFLMVCAMLLLGVFVKGFEGRRFSKTFNIIFVAGVIQMFSAYDNVFSRLADYYLQFLIIYIPMLFYDCETQKNVRVKVPLSYDLRATVAVCIMLFSLWFYNYSSLSTGDGSVDDLTNYRFCWEVQED